jgi:hypothetical protein
MAAPLYRRRAVQTARRLYPLALEAYRRWQRLSPEEKERYMGMMRQAADRGRRVLEQQRRRPPRRWG